MAVSAAFEAVVVSTLEVFPRPPLLVIRPARHPAQGRRGERIGQLLGGDPARPAGVERIGDGDRDRRDRALRNERCCSDVRGELRDERRERSGIAAGEDDDLVGRRARQVAIDWPNGSGCGFHGEEYDEPLLTTSFGVPASFLAARATDADTLATTRAERDRLQAQAAQLQAEHQTLQQAVQAQVAALDTGWRERLAELEQSWQARVADTARTIDSLHADAAQLAATHAADLAARQADRDQIAAQYPESTETLAERR